MNTLGKRIKSFRNNLKMTQKDLASVLQVPRDTVANWEVDRGTPNIEMLQHLADYFDISVDCLLGRNDKEKKSTQPEIPVNGAIPLQKDAILVMPVLSKYGWDSFNTVQETGDYELFDTKIMCLNENSISDYFYLRAEDDSMSPQVSKGDVVLVHKQPTIENGRIGVVKFGRNETVIKRITFIDNKILLISDNPVYDQTVCFTEECSIIGQVGKIIKTAR